MRIRFFCFFLIALVLFSSGMISCEKDDISGGNGNTTGSISDVDNVLVGTTWEYGYPSRGVGFYLDFESNTRVTVTGMYRGNVSSTNYGSYTLSGHYISFANCQCSAPNGISFKLQSASFSGIVMTASGTKNGESVTLTLNKIL